MYYCEKCHRVLDANHCEECNADNLREVKDDDFCFLITMEEGLGKSIMECFKNQDIVYAAIPVGDGVRSQFALSLGNYQLYVHYSKLDEAKQIIGFFTDNDQVGELKGKILKNIDKWHFKTKKIEEKIRKKLKLNNEIDLMQCVKEIVKKANTINDVGLLLNKERGLVVKNESIILWFSAESFEITM